MSVGLLPHKYLFVAVFKDGTEIEQTQEDRSTINPDKSAFFDVLQRQDELAYFYLRDHEKTFMVDLENGQFEIGGVPILKEGGPELFNYRLIYFHRNWQHIKGDTIVAREREYHIGFQANYYEDGVLRSFKQTMIIR